MVRHADGTRGRREAFTLLELLIALSLMALLMGSAYEVLRLARRAQDRAQEAVEIHQVARACLDRIRMDLEGLVQEAGPFNTGLWAEDGPLNRDGVEYPGDYATFLTASNVPRIAARRLDPNDTEALTDPDLLEIQYAVGSTADTGLGLVRSVKRRLNCTLAREEDLWRQEVLAEEVLGLNFRWFDGSEWQETWDSESLEAFPEAVEITLVVGRLRFDEFTRTSLFPDGAPMAREVFTAVVVLRPKAMEKAGAEAADGATVR